MTKKSNMSMMPMSTGGKVLPKLVGTFVAVALLVIVVKHPGEAANALKGFLGVLGSVIEGLWSFIQQLGG